MGDLSLFIPITKVDATQRLVYGIVTAEVEDRAGEICDYTSTKPHYERWSSEIAQSTGGKSLGNLRAMHGPVAAGKVTAITFNDEAKQVEICAKVVDETEWIKVTEGVYTGFSQGGAYERRWVDEAGLTHYTAVPNEISLVDLPCLPQARFEMIKADGTRELRTFEPGSRIMERLEEILQGLGWLEELSSDELDEVPDLAELIGDVHDLAARLASVSRSQETAKQPSRGRGRRGSRIGANATNQAEKAARDGLSYHADQFRRNYEDSRGRSEPYPGTAGGMSANRQADRSIRWGLEKRIDLLSTMLEDVLQRVKNIEKQPLPLPLTGGPRVVAKHEDGFADLHATGTIDSMLTDPEALSILAIRLAQRNGRANF